MEFLGNVNCYGDPGDEEEEDIIIYGDPGD